MNELTDKTKCLVTRERVEFWLSPEQAKNVETLITSSARPEFLDIDGELVKTTEIIGIYTATKMEERRHHLAGDWQCKYGYWHKKYDKCTYADCPAYQKKFPRHN